VIAWLAAGASMVLLLHDLCGGLAAELDPSGAAGRGAG
jgi:hypothetical protein